MQTLFLDRLQTHVSLTPFNDLKQAKGQKKQAADLVGLPSPTAGGGAAGPARCYQALASRIQVVVKSIRTQMAAGTKQQQKFNLAALMGMMRQVSR